jgi:hypothetical protein
MQHLLYWSLSNPTLRDFLFGLDTKLLELQLHRDILFNGAQYLMAPA